MNMLQLYDGEAHAASYIRVRQTAPKMAADKTIKYMKERGASFDCMLDVGCGSGQGTGLFASYFKNIIAIDLSPSQIKWANAQNKHENITYSVGDSGHLPASDGSVDLVASFAAAHWFDVDQFLKECKRALKPKGCLLTFSYNIPYMYPADVVAKISRDELVEVGKRLTKEFESKCKCHPYLLKMEKRYNYIYDAIPSEDKERHDDMKIQANMNLTEFKEYFTSWSGYHTYMKNKRVELIEKYGTDEKIDEHDLRHELIADCKKAWKLEAIEDEKIIVHVIWDAFCFLSSNLI